jgi:hypothetical protein
MLPGHEVHRAHWSHRWCQSEGLASTHQREEEPVSHSEKCDHYLHCPFGQGKPLKNLEQSLGSQIYVRKITLVGNGLKKNYQGHSSVAFFWDYIKRSGQSYQEREFSFRCSFLATLETNAFLYSAVFVWGPPKPSVPPKLYHVLINVEVK